MLVELLRMAVSAGLTPTQALTTVAPQAPPPSREALAPALAGLELGLGLGDVLRETAEAAPALVDVAGALTGSSRLGIAVDDALARVGEDARATLRRAAETRARTASVRLLFPLVLCVLPAFALLALAPSLLAGLTG